MAQHPYQIVETLPLKAPRGKLPYIEDQGRKIADSRLIIHYLKSTYGDPLDAQLSPEEKAIAKAFQRLLEEHLFWVTMFTRWSYTDANWQTNKQAIFGVLKRIGVISDTHGLIRPQALDLLQGCELILHGGDVGKPDVLENLRGIAPVTAVRGNVDRDGGTERLPMTEAVELAGHCFYLLHNLAELDLDPAVAGFSAVIYGHSHQPAISRRDGVLYFNPGSAGPRRFSLPICLGVIEIGDGRLAARIVELAVEIP